MRVGWVWAVVAVALVVGILVVVDRRSEADLSGPVAVVGDSITFVSTGAIRGELETESPPEVKSVLGATTERMLPAARRMAATRPRQAVIELGTNDVLQQVPIDEAEQRYTTMVDAFEQAGVDCIHL